MPATIAKLSDVCLAGQGSETFVCEDVHRTTFCYFNVQFKNKKKNKNNKNNNNNNNNNDDDDNDNDDNNNNNNEDNNNNIMIIIITIIITITEDILKRTSVHQT